MDLCLVEGTATLRYYNGLMVMFGKTVALTGILTSMLSVLLSAIGLMQDPVATVLFRGGWVIFLVGILIEIVRAGRSRKRQP